MLDGSLVHPHLAALSFCQEFRWKMHSGENEFSMLYFNHWIWSRGQMLNKLKCQPDAENSFSAIIMERNFAVIKVYCWPKISQRSAPSLECKRLKIVSISCNSHSYASFRKFKTTPPAGFPNGCIFQRHHAITTKKSIFSMTIKTILLLLSLIAPKTYISWETTSVACHWFVCTNRE